MQSVSDDHSYLDAITTLMIDLEDVARLRRRRVPVDKTKPGGGIRTGARNRIIRVDADLAAEVGARLDLDERSSRFAHGRSGRD